MAKARNAVTTPRGQRTVRKSARMGAEARRSARAEGPGKLLPEQREHLFALAQRLHAARTGPRVRDEGLALRISLGERGDARGVGAQLVAGAHNRPFSCRRSVSYPRKARSFAAPAVVPSTRPISANVIPS